MVEQFDGGDSFGHVDRSSNHLSLVISPLACGSMFPRSVAPGGQSVDQVPPTAASQRVASFDEVNIKSKKAYREQLSTRISAKQQNLKSYEADLKRQRKYYLPDIAHFASDR